MRQAAAAFIAVADLKSARIAFAALSDAVIAYARTPAASGDLSVAFCPMAQKHWLQRGSRIQNPYYGTTMSDCGRIVDR